MYKISKYLGLLSLYFFEKLVSLLQKDKEFYDPTDFNWVSSLEDNWNDIRAELLNIIDSKKDIPNLQDIFEEQGKLTDGQNWKSFILYIYGYRIHNNCKQCPKTDSIVQEIPGMTTAMFSILAPKKHIPPHTGPFKGVLRYHLGVLIPDSNSCWIRVGNKYRYWKEGKSLIFDDTIKHEVYNASDKHRVILFVDFIRELPFPLNWINKFLFYLLKISPFINNVQKKLNLKNKNSYNN